MGFLSWGARQGLSFKNDWTGDLNREMKSQQLDAAAKAAARAEQKANAKDITDNLKFATVNNAYDKAKLLEYVQNEQFPKIGKYVTENPDWQYDVSKRMELLNELNKVSDNAYSALGKSNDENYKALAKWHNDNPDDIDNVDIKAQDEAGAKYQLTGSSDGIAANKKPFVFTKPSDYDPITDAAILAKTTAEKTKLNTNLGSGLYGIEYVLPSDEEVDYTISAYYTRNKSKLNKYYDTQVTTPVKEAFPTSLEWFKETYKRGLKEGVKSASSYPRSGSGSGSGGDSDNTAYKAFLETVDAGRAVARPINKVFGLGVTESDNLIAQNDGKIHTYVKGYDGQMYKSFFKSNDGVIVTDDTEGDIIYENGQPAYVGINIEVSEKDALDIAKQGEGINYNVKNNLLTNTKKNTYKEGNSYSTKVYVPFAENDYSSNAFTKEYSSGGNKVAVQNVYEAAARFGKEKTINTVDKAVKKSIKESDIATKAAAAGYTDLNEYKKILIANGVTIIK
jgi:hypothetical protein